MVALPDPSRPELTTDRVEELHVEGPTAVAPISPVLPVRGASLATILAGHILQDGELVLMILKPSLWFIILSSLKFVAVVLILLIAILISSNNPHPSQSVAYVEAAMMILAGRIMWAVLQWMGRFYILTDLRIVRLGGVFTIELFACPLRKVARTRVQCTTSERIVRTGSIEIVPSDASLGWASWQTIAQPLVVHDQVVAAIDRAKQGGGFPCD